MVSKNSLRVLVACGGVALAGCANMPAARPVAAGDRVGVEFTCRLPDGEIAASTSAQGFSAHRQPISQIFLERKGEGPFLLTAGAGLQGEQSGRSLGFEEVLISRLSEQVIGIGEGESRTLQVRAADLPGQHSVQMALVRVRPKEWSVDRAGYLARTGKEPQVGQEFAMDPLFPGKVTELGADRVTVRFAGKVGSEMETPFGPAIVEEDPQQYRMVLHPRPGSLVRTGYIVGRISKVDERSFTVDYANPLGGATLSCDLKVASVSAGSTDSKQKQEEK